MILWDGGSIRNLAALRGFDGNFYPRMGCGVLEDEFSTGGVGNDEGDLRGFVEEEVSASHFEVEIHLRERIGRVGDEGDASESPVDEGKEGFHGVESDGGLGLLFLAEDFRGWVPRGRWGSVMCSWTRFLGERFYLTRVVGQSGRGRVQERLGASHRRKLR